MSFSSDGESSGVDVGWKQLSSVDKQCNSDESCGEEVIWARQVMVTSAFVKILTLLMPQLASLGCYCMVEWPDSDAHNGFLSSTPVPVACSLAHRDKLCPASNSSSRTSDPGDDPPGSDTESSLPPLADTDKSSSGFSDSDDDTPMKTRPGRPHGPRQCETASATCKAQGCYESKHAESTRA